VAVVLSCFLMLFASCVGICASDRSVASTNFIGRLS
jgi:hypothetical protein